MFSSPLLVLYLWIWLLYLYAWLCFRNHDFRWLHSMMAVFLFSLLVFSVFLIEDICYFQVVFLLVVFIDLVCFFLFSLLSGELTCFSLFKVVRRWCKNRTGFLAFDWCPTKTIIMGIDSSSRVRSVLMAFQTECGWKNDWFIFDHKTGRISAEAKTDRAGRFILETCNLNNSAIFRWFCYFKLLSPCTYVHKYLL